MVLQRVSIFVVETNFGEVQTNQVFDTHTFFVCAHLLIFPALMSKDRTFIPFVWRENFQSFASENGALDRELEFLPGKWNAIGNFPSWIPHYDNYSNLTPEQKENVTNSAGRIGWKNISPVTIMLSPSLEFNSRGFENIQPLRAIDDSKCLF